MAHILMASISFDLDSGGGPTRIVADVCRSLQGNGHDVSVICCNVDGKRPPFELRDGINIYRYTLPNRPLNLTLAHDHIEAARRLLSTKMVDPPDVIHGHAPFQFLAAVDVFPMTPSRVYTIHSPAVKEMEIVWGKQGRRGALKRLLGLPRIRAIEVECFRRATAVTALSRYTIELIESLYGAEMARRIVKIPGWTDLGSFQILSAEAVAEARKKLGWPLDKPVFFVLRRLEARMGLENLLLAVAELKAQGYDFAVAIGGKGSLAERLHSLCAELRLTDTVSFMGFVPDSILPKAYGACDASIVPTLALECFGIIVLESLACGRPALVTPVGALPESVAGIEPRWIANGADAPALAVLLRSFLDKAIPNHSPETMRSFVATHFNAEVGMKAMASVLLDSSGSAKATKP